MPNQHSGEHRFPNIQPIPLKIFMPFPCVLLFGHLREEIGVCTSSSPCEEAVDCICHYTLHKIF